MTNNWYQLFLTLTRQRRDKAATLLHLSEAYSLIQTLQALVEREEQLHLDQTLDKSTHQNTGTIKMLVKIKRSLDRYTTSKHKEQEFPYK